MYVNVDLESHVIGTPPEWLCRQHWQLHLPPATSFLASCQGVRISFFTSTMDRGLSNDLRLLNASSSLYSTGSRLLSCSRVDATTSYLGNNITVSPTFRARPILLRFPSSKATLLHSLFCLSQLSIDIARMIP
jgi:hypothetical protein